MIHKLPYITLFCNLRRSESLPLRCTEIKITICWRVLYLWYINLRFWKAGCSLWYLSRKYFVIFCDRATSRFEYPFLECAHLLKFLLQREILFKTPYSFCVKHKQIPMFYYLYYSFHV